MMATMFPMSFTSSSIYEDLLNAVRVALLLPSRIYGHPFKQIQEELQVRQNVAFPA